MTATQQDRRDAKATTATQRPLPCRPAAAPRCTTTTSSITTRTDGGRETTRVHDFSSGQVFFAASFVTSSFLLLSVRVHVHVRTGRLSCCTQTSCTSYRYDHHVRAKSSFRDPPVECSTKSTYKQGIPEDGRRIVTALFFLLLRRPWTNIFDWAFWQHPGNMELRRNTIRQYVMFKRHAISRTCISYNDPIYQSIHPINRTL